MSRPDAPLVVIGVGNVLLGDDGAGVRAIEQLRRRAAADPDALPRDTRLVDGGTLGLELLPHLDGARGLLVIDAAARGAAPGTVTVLRDARITGNGGVAELLGVARMLGVLPPAVAVLEVGVQGITSGIGLSPAVEAAMPAVATAALLELRSMAAPTGVSA